MLIKARPNKGLIFTLVADPSDAVQFMPSDTFNLYNPNREIAFQMDVKREGVVRISYHVAGTDFMDFQKPADTVVLVQKLASQRMSIIPDTNFADDNCYGSVLDRCNSGDDGQVLSLESSCPWTASGSKGYISVRAGNMNLPVSLAGVVFQNKDGGVQTFRNSGVMTVARETQSMLLGERIQCDAKDTCQGLTSINQPSHDFLIQRNVFLRSFMLEYLKATPWWLALNLPFSYTGFHANDIQSLLVKDSRIRELKCSNLPSDLRMMTSGIYSAAIFQAPVEVKVMENSLSMESPEHTCFLKSLCGVGPNGVHKTLISFPKDVSMELSIGTGINLKVQGFGFDNSDSSSGNNSFTKSISNRTCGNVPIDDTSFIRVEKCIEANGWFKGSVSLKTLKSNVDFQGEFFVENDAIDKVSNSFYSNSNSSVQTLSLKVHSEQFCFCLCLLLYFCTVWLSDLTRLPIQG